MSPFRAFRIFDENGQTASRFVDMTLDQLDPGDVVIRAVYSSINYKDALAATGAGKVIRRFPCNGGVDVAGVVDFSTDPNFKPGDEVIVTGYDMGVSHDGGFSEYVRVPAAWVVPLPLGLTLFDAMALGTAGFTAALSIYRLEQNDLKPDNGSVLVTGATGGVGSLAVIMLAQLGYRVVAVTGKPSEQAYLKSLGASEVLLRSDIDLASTRALEKAQWAGALDAVGGTMLSWLVRSMMQGGAIASFGNTGGAELHTTVYPFILRGVRLVGIDSASTLMPLRQKIWLRLAHELLPKKLQTTANVVSFEQIPVLCQQMLQGQSHGRKVVRIG